MVHARLSSAALATALLVAAACAPQVQPAPPAPEAPATLELERPIPYPIDVPRGFVEAVARGTRTERGVPGDAYWQQHADYRILAHLDPASERVEGTVRIRYRNESPDSLPLLFVHLHQNLHASGVIRNEPQEVTGGVEVMRVVVAGRELAEGAAGYQVDGTRMAVRLPSALRSGSTAEVEIDWAFQVPTSGAGRMGHDRGEVFFIAYWFPQMAVYDDVVGWQTDPYQGQGEFYLDFADYDVTITAPEGWLVRGTGEHRNPEEVFPADVLERLRRAEVSDEPVVVLDQDAFDAGRATVPTQAGAHDWRFTAENVRDFTFSATRRSRWEVARTPVGDRTGDGQVDYTRIESIYRPDIAPLWTEVADYGQHAITFLSEYLDFPYPWPHMTLVEGGDIIGGGMEFPMITLIGTYEERGATALYGVTAHELAHMWIPMIVGSDEKRYAWLDEGHTVFNTAEAMVDYFDGRVDRHAEDMQGYVQVARTGQYWPMMLWTDQHPTALSWVTAMYRKPASVLQALRGILGEETFLEAHREFVRRWAYHLPTPWDFFNTVEDVSGRDLEWFWRSWYYETWTLDQAVGSVERAGNGSATIVIEDRGNVPMPAPLTVTREDGSVESHEVPVERWLQGVRTAEVRVGAGSPVVRVEIDAEHHFPDVDRGTNVWEAGVGAGTG
jgi:hypothetical protein